MLDSALNATVVVRMKHTAKPKSYGRTGNTVYLHSTLAGQELLGTQRINIRYNTDGKVERTTLLYNSCDSVAFAVLLPK